MLMQTSSRGSKVSGANIEEALLSVAEEELKDETKTAFRRRSCAFS